MTVPYRPSNATEGDCFISTWCLGCAKHWDGGGQVLARTFAHDINDPEYPAEWVRDLTGTPLCTAFLGEGEQAPPARCRHTIDMFGAVA